MAGRELVVVKLGGAVITFKERPLTPNPGSMGELSRRLSQLDAPKVLVHGGGSFGHHYARRYGLDTQTRRASPEGVSKTRAAMLELHLMLVRQLQEHGLHPHTLPPSEFLLNRRILRAKMKRLKELAFSGLTPVTFGDVVSDGDGFYIVSGDSLMRMISCALRPSAAVFTLDVDGVYPNAPGKGRWIREIDPSRPLNLVLSVRETDVTGGMKRKLQEAVKIARAGVDVYFVNGFKPERMVEALKDHMCEGTVIRGVKSEG